MIHKCSCKSPYQDSRHGAGNRVHTEGGKEFSCTVCGNRVPIPYADQRR